MSQMTSCFLFLSGPVPARLVPEMSRDSRQGREVTRDSMK